MRIETWLVVLLGLACSEQPVERRGHSDAVRPVPPAAVRDLAFRVNGQPIYRDEVAAMAAREKVS